MEPRFGYTILDELGCILQQAAADNPERSLTYPECASELERALPNYFPDIDQEVSFFPLVVDQKTHLPFRIDPETLKPVDDKEYCRHLFEVGRQLYTKRN